MSDLDDIKVEIGPDFEPVPAGVYPVMISNIKKIEGKKFQSEEKETQLNFEFSILEGDHAGLKLYKRIRPKLSTGKKPSFLYQVWAAAEQRNPTSEEFGKFHISELLEKALRVVTEQVDRDGVIYNNITNFWPLDEAKKK